MRRGARLPHLRATVLQRMLPESEPVTASAGFLKAIRGRDSNLLGSKTEKGWKQLRHPWREQRESEKHVLIE